VGAFVVFTVFVSLFQIYAFAVGHWKGAPFLSSSEKQARAMMRLAGGMRSFEKSYGRS